MRSRVLVSAVALLSLVLAVGAIVSAPRARAADQPAREFQECTNCPVMVAIPAGKFVMGSPKSEPGHFDAEGPQHIVGVRAFALGKYDVTVAQFRAFLQDTKYQPAPCNSLLHESWRVDHHGLAYPPYDVEPPRWPAVCLDWKDAEVYIAWLNGQVRAAHAGVSSRGPYRLPSEAEWEYAARGGTTTSRWWGNDIGTTNANCNGCGSKWDDRELAEIGSFAPNPFGLYDVLGNAWQWTSDCWHPSYVDAPTNGRSWTADGNGNCAKHVLRGGSWDNVPIFIRSAARTGSTADGGEFDYSSLAGFRVARDLP